MITDCTNVDVWKAFAAQSLIGRNRILLSTCAPPLLSSHHQVTPISVVLSGHLSVHERVMRRLNI